MTTNLRNDPKREIPGFFPVLVFKPFKEFGKKIENSEKMSRTRSTYYSISPSEKPEKSDGLGGPQDPPEGGSRMTPFRPPSGGHFGGPLRGVFWTPSQRSVWGSKMTPLGDTFRVKFCSQLGSPLKPVNIDLAHVEPPANGRKQLIFGGKSRFSPLKPPAFRQNPPYLSYKGVLVAGFGSPQGHFCR